MPVSALHPFQMFFPNFWCINFQRPKLLVLTVCCFVCNSDEKRVVYVMLSVTYIFPEKCTSPVENIM